MRKQSFLRIAVAAMLCGSGSVNLMAQRGMGGHGLGDFHETASRGRDMKDSGRTHSAAARSGRMAGLSGMSVTSALANNAGLSAILTPLLPAGESLAVASAGFKNVGQFVAALHVSQNLNIPFDALKARLTGSNPESLGQAIHDLQPSLTRSTVHGDVHSAEREADADLDSARIANQFAANPTLATAAQGLLPSGTNLQAAAAGFENLRQFLLAEYLAKDLNISFSQLKADVTGTNAMSFRDALSALLPSLSQTTIKADIATARQQSQTELQAVFGSSKADSDDLALGH